MSIKNKKERLDIAISMFVVALAGLLIYYFGFSANQNSSFFNENDGAENFPKSIEIANIKYDVLKEFTEIETINTQTYPINTITSVETINEPQALIESDLSKSDIVLDSQKIRILHFKFPSIRDSLKSDSLESQYELDSSDYFSIFEDTLKGEILDDPTLLVEKDQECIIVIGAFKREKNITHLISQLEKDQFQIFRAAYKGTTRIGIYQACDDKILRQSLKSVRQKYAKDALIYRASE